MIFIGGGALLTQAVGFAIKIGLSIDAVCCPINDSSIPKLKKSNVFILETNNPNVDLLALLNKIKKGSVFSINNRFILEDHLLSSGPSFFNIHNGLVQNYRGVAEVCIFGAICSGEKTYGVTLHKLLPGQKVDSGPVVTQLQFSIEQKSDFHCVMKQSLQMCQKIFEDNIVSIVSNTYKSSYIELQGSPYSYRDVDRICTEADPINLIKASNFGTYRHFFPKLVELLSSH